MLQSVRHEIFGWKCVRCTLSNATSRAASLTSAINRARLKERPPRRALQQSPGPPNPRQRWEGRGHIRSRRESALVDPSERKLNLPGKKYKVNVERKTGNESHYGRLAGAEDSATRTRKQAVITDFERVVPVVASTARSHRSSGEPSSARRRSEKSNGLSQENVSPSRSLLAGSVRDATVQAAAAQAKMKIRDDTEDNRLNTAHEEHRIDRFRGDKDDSADSGPQQELLEEQMKKIRLMKDRIKYLSKVFPNTVPQMLTSEEMRKTDFGVGSVFRQKVEAEWERLFAERPGRIGAVFNEYNQLVTDIRIQLEKIKSMGLKHKYFDVARQTFLGRMPGGLFPSNSQWVRRYINTGYQRSLAAKLKPDKSPWARVDAVTIEEYAKENPLNKPQTQNESRPRRSALPDRKSLRDGLESVTARPASVIRDEQSSNPSRAVRESAPAKNAPAKRHHDALGPTEFTDSPFQLAGMHSRTNNVTKPEARKQSATRQGEAQPGTAMSAWFDPDGPNLPYATAASNFIYGKSAALACLRANRRRINRAWVQEDSSRRTDAPDKDIMALLHKQRIPISPVRGSREQQMMNRVTQGRPHNGVVLDVAPLPYPPIKNLGSLDLSNRMVQLNLHAQSPEERLANASLANLPLPSESWRSPLVVYLDGIKDEGNMGNIIRTAYFYGVDAIAVCAGTCAPATTSAVVSKAASGALEAMPLLRVDNEFEFLRQSARVGWQILASVAPDTPPQSRSRDSSPPGLDADKARRDRDRGRTAPMLSTAEITRSPLADAPCVLMLGNEGEGLREKLVALADAKITIPARKPRGGRDAVVVDLGVDSMNVASAAAVLLDVLMRKPVGLDAVSGSEGREGRCREDDFGRRRCGASEPQRRCGDAVTGAGA